MMTSSTPGFENPNISDPEFNEMSDKVTNLVDLSIDPNYLKLIDLYERAEFSDCLIELAELEKRYPGYPELIKFKDDLHMRLSLKTMAVTDKKREKQHKRKATLNLGVFAIVGTLFMLIAFFFSYYYLTINEKAKQLENETAQLTALNDQAEQLLLAGQPKPVVEIIARIMAINPDFENATKLTERTADLLQLEVLYQEALDLIKENKNIEALVILEEIEAEKPGMWDVSQQIASIETSIQIAAYLDEGSAAYQAENWGEVVSAYENALKLDPALADPLMKEQLLRGYLNMIISMLQNDNASITDIENAEQYYRRAVALIPQNKDFAMERGNLQEVSSNMLNLKYSQTAQAMLEDRDQTFSSISKAVSYLNKAANFDPNNTALQTDLKNAELYQVAFQNFAEMNWVSAVTNLNQLLSADPNYANGNARILLFEAYYALGKQYFSAGTYQDARVSLEQAEILAKEDSENLMKLFQVQLLLGDTIGKMEAYMNAVSYYQHALDAIQVTPILEKHPTITVNISQANDLAINGNYQEAFIAYQEALKDINIIYTISEREIHDGVCLAFFANDNLSTVDAVLSANDLPMTMVITFGRNLKVPMLGN
jgi:tetratricopeptide (TPR) repeat protein